MSVLGENIPPTDAWSAVDAELRRSMPETTHELWFSQLRATDFEAGLLTIGGPPRAIDWVNRRYRPLLEDVARRALGDEIRVALVSGSETPGTSGAHGLALNPNQTFESLVIGKGNRVAHAAALAVAESPGQSYSPLFIHGAPGVGKTHILNSIGNYITRRHPDQRVLYTTGEQFTSEFVHGLRHNGHARFKELHRGVDVLLIDDIQILEGKNRTEEEFLHTFNELHAAGKQIVLTSDRPASAMPALAERLRDRLEWGLTVEVDPPDLRTRLALIWRMKSKNAPEIVDPAALREIADRSGGNARLLEGAITRVLALSSILSEPVTPEFVAKALGDKPVDNEPTPDRPRATPEQIRSATASHFGVTVEQIDSRSRLADVAKARQVAMYLCAQLLDMSPTEIGRLFDRDQSTVTHAIKQIEERNVAGETLAGDIQQIRITLATGDGTDGYPADMTR